MNPEEARSNFEDRLERYSFASSVLFVTANLALDGTVAVFGGIRFRAEPPCVLLIVVAFGLTWLIAVFYLLYNFIKGLKVVENRITTLEEDRPHRSIGVELVILECMSLARSLWHGGSECWSETRAILQDPESLLKRLDKHFHALQTDEDRMLENSSCNNKQAVGPHALHGGFSNFTGPS